MIQSIPSRLLPFFLGLALTAVTAHATPLSFGEAQQRLEAYSDAIQAAQAQVSSKQEQAQAVKSLDYPSLELQAQYLKYQKTLQPSSLNLPLPLPLPNEITLKHNSFSPALVTTWPIYSGGKIRASQEASRVAVRGAQAQLDEAMQQKRLQLIERYFGQQLLEHVLAIRADIRNGLAQHLKNTQILEDTGLATRAQRLQAQVAHDAAQRAFERARIDLDSARAALSRLLYYDTPLTLSSSLFIILDPIEALEDFLSLSSSQNPLVRQLQAKHAASQQNLLIQEAQWQPQVFLFGSYRFNRHRALMNDPDWATGIGVSFPLFANIDRQSSVRSAEHERSQAQAMLDESRNMLHIVTQTAYNNLKATQQDYRLLNSSLASATENVRIQQLAFQEGQGTSVDVIDARNMLGKARLEQTQAAYGFIMALAQLLNAAGELDRFDDYLSQGQSLALPMTKE